MSLILDSQTIQRHHFRYRKITPEDKQLMRSLCAYGLSQAQIATVFECCRQVVCYHLDEEQRMKTIERAKKSIERNGKKARTESNKKWNREYLKDRYHNDPEFRMKVIRANSGGKFAEPLLREACE